MEMNERTELDHEINNYCAMKKPKKDGESQVETKNVLSWLAAEGAVEYRLNNRQEAPVSPFPHFRQGNRREVKTSKHFVIFE